MKRFSWPLQRLLEVTGQREQARRAELLALSRRMARLRRQSLQCRGELRDALTELGGSELGERIRRQDVVMSYTQAGQRRIDRIEEDLSALSRQRTEKTNELLRVRKSRETLERLREEARAEHERQQRAAEQKQFDETAHVSKARQQIAARILDGR